MSPKLKIIYHTQPCFFDYALMEIKELSQECELHVTIELTPFTWNGSIFNLPPKQLSDGFSSAKELLIAAGQDLLWEYLQDCASVNIFFYKHYKLYNPLTWHNSLALIKHYKKTRPHLIFFDEINIKTAPLLWMIRHFPLALSIHDPNAHSGEYSWKRELARKFSLPFINQIILHSQRLVKPFHKKYHVSREKICAISLGPYDIYTRYCTRPIQAEPKTILFFGRLSKYKGIEVLMKAVKIVAHEIPNIKVIVAGGSVAGYTLPPIPELENNGTIELLDRYISKEELAVLFNRTTITVCPYLDATQSGVVLTSYAFGKPVITTNTGGLPEYVKDKETGLIVTPGDANDLSAAIKDILTNKTKLRELTKGIEKFKKEEIGWKTLAHRTLATYQNAIANHEAGTAQ